MILDNVKKMLDIDEERDQTMIEKLQWIIESAEKRLCLFLGGVEDVPAELEYIVAEVAIVRFNRISSEGTTSHSVEGESISWSDDDFAGYRKDIEAWNKEHKKGSGIVRFI